MTPKYVADTPGVLTALYVQRPWPLSGENIYDAKKELLKLGEYQVTYQEIDATKSVDGHVVSLVPNRRFETFVNELDLVLDGVEKLSGIVKSLAIVVGKTVVDSLDAEDLETQIRTNAVLFGRRFGIEAGKLFVPLVMAPVHSNNLLYVRGKQAIAVRVEFHENVSPGVADGARLFGCTYAVRESGIARTTSYALVTVRNQIANVRTSKKPRPGAHANEVILRLDGPVALIYFWGCDKSKITNVILKLNGYDFYNGGLCALEHFKKSRGFDFEPVAIFLSDDRVAGPHGSIPDFSRVDYATLVVETTDDTEADLFVVGLSLLRMTFSSGTYKV